MVITHLAENEVAKAGAEALAKDLREWFARFQEVARNDAMRQKTVKEARYYEGKAEAYRYVAEFIEKLAIETD